MSSQVYFDSVFFATHDFRRHSGQSTQGRSHINVIKISDSLGEAEVPNLVLFVVFEDVFALKVAMDDIVLVQLLHSKLMVPRSQQ